MEHEVSMFGGLENRRGVGGRFGGLVKREWWMCGDLQAWAPLIVVSTRVRDPRAQRQRVRDRESAEGFLCGS